MKSVRLVSISILRPPGTPLDNTVRHLKSAGALVSFFTKPTDLVAHIANEVPDIIFMCVEYPQEQVQNTISIINKSVQVPIFGFSRNLTPLEKQLLTFLPFEGTLDSDISGAKAEATVLNYFNKKTLESDSGKPASKPALQDLASIQDYNRTAKREIVSNQLIKKEISKELYNQGKISKSTERNKLFTVHFEKYIKNTISKIQAPSDHEFHDDQLSYEISELNIFEFQMDSTNFSFIFAPLDDKAFNIENINIFKTHFFEEIKKDHPSSKISDPVQITIPRSRIRDWLNDVGLSFTITSIWQRPCYLGIIETRGNNSFEVKPVSGTEYLEVSILSVPMNIALPYNIYIFLNMNQVYFPYQTRGNIMTTKSLAKLSSLKINTVFIHASEVSQYRQRISFKNISETIFGYISKQQTS